MTGSWAASAVAALVLLAGGPSLGVGSWSRAEAGLFLLVFFVGDAGGSWTASAVAALAVLVFLAGGSSLGVWSWSTAGAGLFLLVVFVEDAGGGMVELPGITGAVLVVVPADGASPFP